MTAIILTALVVVGLAVNGLRLRARVPSALPVVDPSVGVHDGRLGSHDGRLGCEWRGLPRGTGHPTT